MPITYFKIDQSLNDQGPALERIAPQNQHRWTRQEVLLEVQSSSKLVPSATRRPSSGVKHVTGINDSQNHSQKSLDSSTVRDD